MGRLEELVSPAIAIRPDPSMAIALAASFPDPPKKEEYVSWASPCAEGFSFKTNASPLRPVALESLGSAPPYLPWNAPPVTGKFGSVVLPAANIEPVESTVTAFTDEKKFGPPM